MGLGGWTTKRDLGSNDTVPEEQAYTAEQQSYIEQENSLDDQEFIMESYVPRRFLLDDGRIKETTAAMKPGDGIWSVGSNKTIVHVIKEL